MSENWLATLRRMKAHHKASEMGKPRTRVAVPQEIECPRCSGWGFVLDAYEDDCVLCQGRGVEPIPPREVFGHIPKGPCWICIDMPTGERCACCGWIDE